MPAGKTSLDTDLFAALAARVIERLPRDINPNRAKALIEMPALLTAALNRALVSSSVDGLNYEEILERFQRLDKRACVRMRPPKDFPRTDSRWYTDIGSVVLSGESGGYCSFFENGGSPEEALIRMWQTMLANNRPGNFFIRYHCPPDVPIPGDGPQVWVRWNQDLGDWEDVVPTWLTQTNHRTATKIIRPYKEHRCIEQCTIR